MIEIANFLILILDCLIKENILISILLLSVISSVKSSQLVNIIINYNA